MTYRGKVKNGVVELEGDDKLPDGTEVRVEPIRADESKARPEIYERLSQIAGKARGLPSDLARQHDHYLHGQEKR